jgi:hypothetical protein
MKCPDPSTRRGSPFEAPRDAAAGRGTGGGTLRLALPPVIAMLFAFPNPAKRKPEEIAMSHPSLTFVAALGAALALTLAPASAEVVKYKANLDGPSENPPTTSKGVGAIEADYDVATKTLNWSGSYSGLTGPETAAHFHGPAAVGKNAPPIVPVEAKSSPFKGTAKLTDEQAKEFADGLVYFNVHTEQNKGGEIRGQLAPAK